MSTSSDKVKCSDNLPLKVLMPKKNEQLDNVINKLKNKCSGFNKQNSNGPESISSSKEIDETTTTFKEDTSKNKCTADQSANFVRSNIDWTSTDDKYLNKNFITWENNSNLCWLDASMSLLVHNKTLCHSIPKDSSTQTAKILKSYEEAISIFNDHSNDKSIEERLQNAKDILKSIQESVLEYLKPFLKCDEGKPDSAFCSLLNLISKEKEIKKQFNVRYAWHLICKKCLFSTVRNCEKPIITFNEVKHFIPYSPVSLWKCPKCEAPKQEIYLEYKTLPQCLIFHFENGVGKGEFDAEKLDFEVNGRKYKLSGVLTLQKGITSFMNHFVTWIRDVITGLWLECDDLDSDVSSFTISQPTIRLEDVSIVAYEAIDNDGTVILKEDFEDVSVENDEDYPVIDLADESKDDTNDQTYETDADKLKQSSSRSEEKNCNESASISADSVNNKTFQFRGLNDVIEFIATLDNGEIIMKDMLQKKDLLVSLDSVLEEALKKDKELYTNLIYELVNRKKNNVTKVYVTHLINSIIACCSSNIVSENNIASNAIKETLKKNLDDIFKSESENCSNEKKIFPLKTSENCSNEKKIFPLNISENVTSGTVHKKADEACFLQKEPLYETTEIQVKKSDLILQRELELGNEVQKVSKNPAKEITKHSKPISSKQKHTICIEKTENSKKEKHFYGTRSKRKKSTDNSALETVPKSGKFASKPSENFSREKNQIKRAIKTACNSSTPNAIKQKKTSVTEDEIMPCAKYALKEVSVVIKKLKESELSKYISSDHKDVNELNSDNTTEKKQGAVVSASLTIDRSSVRNEEKPMRVQRHSTEELTNTIVVKSKIRKTKTQQNLRSQLSNASEVLSNVSVLDKNDKSSVENFMSEPSRRSSRILAHRQKSENAINNEGECVKKGIEKRKLKQNEKLPDAVVSNAQTKSIVEGKNKFSPEFNETERSIKRDELQAKISETKSADACKNDSDSSLKKTSKKKEEASKKEIPKSISEQTLTKCINESKLKQNEKLPDAIVNNAQAKSITKGKSKFSPELNGTEHNIKSDELETKISKTISMDACKNYSDSSLERTSKIEEETLKKEIPERSSEQVNTLCSSNLDAGTENLKRAHVKSDLDNMKRKKLCVRKTYTYKSLTVNGDLISSNHGLVNNNTKKGIKTNKLNGKETNAMHLNEFSELFGTLPDNLSFLSESDKKMQNHSYLVNNKSCKISESTDDYNSVPEKTSEKSNVSNKVGVLASYQEKERKAIITKDSVPKLNKSFQDHSNKSVTSSKESLSYSETSRHTSTKSSNHNQTSKSNDASKIICTPLSNENHDEFFSRSKRRKIAMSNQINKATDKTKAIFSASPNENLCEASSSKRQKKISIPRLKTISGNISKKICPRFDMLTPCEKKKKRESTEVNGIIPARRKMARQDLDVDLQTELRKFLEKKKKIFKNEEISNLTFHQESYHDFAFVPSNSNDNQMNGLSTAFIPSANGNCDKISIQKRDIQNASNIDKKSLKSLPNSNLLDSVRTNSTPKHSPKKNNSNAANLKREIHPNNSDVDIHSVQAHHTNNEMEVVDKKAVRDRSNRASFDRMGNKYNSNTANLKSEMHQNTMDSDLHSAQAQHHTNNEVEIVDKEAAIKKNVKQMYKATKLILGVFYEHCVFGK
ncbi:UNVERIFIED_CONTAM: Uspl1 [Trichonephila clavipes]